MFLKFLCQGCVKKNLPKGSWVVVEGDSGKNPPEDENTPPKENVQPSDSLGDPCTNALGLTFNEDVLQSSEPLLGIKFLYFEQFIKENGGRMKFKGKSTADVNAEYFVPMCQRTNMSLCQQLLLQSSPYVGKPTWFISHAWLCQFLDVVDAVALTLRQQEGEDKYLDTVVWFDQLTLNQTGSKHVPYEMLHDTFMNTTRQIGKMVLVFDRWDNPAHLMRAWCVFEAYAAVHTQSQLEVAMTKTEQQRFLTDITADYKGELFYNMLAKIKSEASVATLSTDTNLIHQCIINNVPDGFVGLDRALFCKLEEWMIKLLQTKVAVSENSIVEATWKYALADILRRRGQFDRAQPYIESSVSIRSMELGEEHIDTLRALNNMALLYQAQKKNSEAERLLASNLEIYRRKLGNEHPDTLSSIQSLAGLYYLQGMFDRAEILSIECSTTSRRVLGDEHPDTLTYINYLAALYKLQRKFDESFPLYQNCLTSKIRVFGKEHPSTLMTLWHLAGLYNEQGKFADAESAYIECLTGYRRVLGESHPTTQQCFKMYQQMMGDSRNQ